MKTKSILIILLTFLITITGYSQVKQNWYDIIGSAYLDNKSYDMLERICDEAGGRVLGSPQNEKAMRMLKEELKGIGYEAKSEKFTIPGWVRGNDVVKMLTPTERKLKAVALGYVDKTPTFQAGLVFVKYGFDENYSGINAEGKVVLVTQERPKGKAGLLRAEMIKIAQKHGARGILFINTKPGALNLAGTGNFQGDPVKIPAYSLTMEEGKWLQRLCEKGEPVKMEITTNSYCKQVETANTVASLKGKVADKIVIGAHFDAWDLGQGGVDNGIGSAILFDVARLMKKYSPENYYSVDFVWFNGEELGLWGSKKYMEMHKKDKIIAMINMDMTGTPTGFNAMGFDEYVPFLEKLKNELNGFDLKAGVVSQPGTNSDHMPFMFAGIPTISLQAHLDPEQYKYYHEIGDTFDKVNKKYLSDAAAVISILTEELANNNSVRVNIRSSNEMSDMLKKYKLDDILKREGEWIYGNK